MMQNTQSSSASQTQPKRLSYKFQRLRESIRRAIESGELSGKLPGERQLAERFGVNAKTLSKALTDLAAEGLLERTIGRGTFVRGSMTPTVRQRWLILEDPGSTTSSLARRLADACPESQIVQDDNLLRPSFLNQFTAVVDLGTRSREALLRDLVVRNVQVVVAGREPGRLSVNSVLVDTVLGAGCAARDLLAAGHQTIAAVESSPTPQVEYALQKTAERFGQANVIRVASDELELAMDQRATAFVCDGVATARRVLSGLQKLGLRVPTDASVMAVGCLDGQPPCSGYLVDESEMAEAVISLLTNPNHRPVTLWLVGRQVDAGTTAGVATASAEAAYMPISNLAMLGANHD